MLGRFLPPHSGHIYLCDTARRLVDELTILVVHGVEDVIPARTRLRWMRELFPHARILDGDAATGASLRDLVRAAHPEPIDLLFAGNADALPLAAELGATLLPIGLRDEAGAVPTRRPVAARAIRADPWKH